MGTTECPLCWVETHSGNPNTRSVDPHKLSVKEIQKEVRKKIKAVSPTVSVRAGRGTARLWMDIMGSKDEFGRLTDLEVEQLKKIGIRTGLSQSVQLNYDDQIKLFEVGRLGLPSVGVDGECATVREILESECLKAKRIIDKELGDTWPFCDVLNEYFAKCS